MLIPMIQAVEPVTNATTTTQIVSWFLFAVALGFPASYLFYCCRNTLRLAEQLLRWVYWGQAYEKWAEEYEQFMEDNCPGCLQAVPFFELPPKPQDWPT